MQIPVPTRFKAWVCGLLRVGIAGSNPAAAWISVFYERYVLSGRDLCDGAIICPEESY